MTKLSSRSISLRRILILASLFGGASLLYAPTFNHQPIWDDHAFVFGQSFLRQCGNLRRVLSSDNFMGVLRVRGSARPVWLASVLIDTCIGGGAIQAYRATSVLWHALGALLLSYFANKMPDIHATPSSREIFQAK